MKPPSKAKPLTTSHCMSEMDLYSYFARTPGERSLAELEAHVSACPHCLDELAELIKLLHPEPEQASRPTQKEPRRFSSKERNHQLLPVASKHHRVLNTLPEEEFISRDSDIQGLFHCGLDVARGLTPSLFFTGPRKSGKTEILKRVYSRLFLEQSEIIPFFHSVPKSMPTAEAFCREYFLDSLLQLMAFLKRDAQLVNAKELSQNTVLQLAYESRHPWLVELVDHFYTSLRKKDLQMLVKLTLHFPDRVSARSGHGAFVIVDDFHHVAELKSEEELGLLTGDFLTALQSRQAPHLLAIPSTRVLESFFRTTEIPGHAEIYPLKPLDADGACRLLERLCDRFDVALEKGLSLSIVEQLDYQPFYIRAIVQGARRDEARLESFREFAEVYTNEITRGSLYIYFSGILNSAKLNSLEQVKALELLNACCHLPLDSSAFEHFREESVDGEWEPARVLNELTAVYLIENTMGIASPIEDRIFGDWVEWNVQHTLRRMPREQAAYKTTVRTLKHLHMNLHFRRASDRLECLERVLGHMNCQSIPSSLLDFDQLAEIEKIQEPEKLSSLLESQEQAMLPEILSVNRLTVKPSVAAGYPWTLVTARGFEDGQYTDGTDTTWVAAYCLDRDPVGLDEIQDFFNQCRRLELETHMERTHLWLVVETRFNQAAMSFAHMHGIMTSSPLQFALIESRILPAPLKHEGQTIPSDSATFELTIPCGPDTELVAVKAMDQVSEIAEFGENAKGQIRMAIMEACINAKESAGSPDARIHLQFQAGENSLAARVRVEQPGRNEQMLSQPSAAMWNLKLLNTLMDDVRIIDGQMGRELVMIKHLRNTMPMAGAG